MTADDITDIQKYNFNTMWYKSANFCHKTRYKWKIWRPSNISERHNEDLTWLQM